MLPCLGSFTCEVKGETVRECLGADCVGAYMYILVTVLEGDVAVLMMARKSFPCTPFALPPPLSKRAHQTCMSHNMHVAV
jgi:hypothetical protein